MYTRGAAVTPLGRDGTPPWDEALKAAAATDKVDLLLLYYSQA